MELPAVLWRVRTTLAGPPATHHSSCILPTDLDYGAPRVRAYDEQGAKTSLEDAMDQLDEARNVALLGSVKYQ